MRRSMLALLALSVSATPLAAQRQTEDNAFSWSGRIPSGHWIRVRNLSGDIDVTASNSDRVEVTATKRWRRSDPQSVRIEVRKFGPTDDDVVICAIWNDRTNCDENGYESHNTRNNDVSVQFRVAVPRGVKIGVSTVNGAIGVEGATSVVEANTVNGEVEATSSGGPVTASTVNGSVTARMGRFDSDEDLNFSTVNGSVVVEFTGDLDADVELSTVNGGFHTDYPVTVNGRLDPRHLRARLGRGGRRIRLSTVNGNVELRRRG
jgi:putative adhesin